MGKTVDFPFSAIIGSEAAKRALLLLAIDPGLKGVLIGAGTGSAKSTLARSFAAVSGDDKPLISVPANITEQNLLGGLDVEQSIAAGKRVYLPGLLARADGGILFIEDVNSLDAKVASHIASALDSGIVKIERDCFSAVYRTEFRLIGAYNPADGHPGAALFDRVGMIVESSPIRTSDERADIITRSIQFSTNPHAFGQQHALAEQELKAGVERARAILPKIEIAREQIRSLAQVALSLGINGSRIDLFAVKAARASAASCGRNIVEEDDLIVAIQLVLMPRATTLPQLEQVAKPDEPVRTEQSSGDNLDDSTEHDSKESDEQSAGTVAPIEDLIIKAIDTSVPEFLFERMRSLHRESKSGKHGTPLHADRGRAITGDNKRRRQSRIALFATLCAAAPFQAMRRNPSRSLIIKKSDIRFKRFKDSSGILFIFAVDASGSMALNRMAQAKGALARILQQAYLHRDKVALVSFRGERADTLLAPTRSLERAKSLIDSLPAGGGTPIAAGLVRALEMANSARLRGMSQVMVVLMTDGRANVASRASRRVDRIDQDAINEELRQIGRIMQSAAIQSVVIDTKSKFVSSGEARNLADLLGGKYLYLPRVGAAGIHKAVEAAASGMRRNNSVW